MHAGRMYGVKLLMISKIPSDRRRITKIIQTAREVGGEGCVDVINEEVEEHIEDHQKVLTNEELEDLVKSSTEE
jgi:hypothetical protein